MFRALFIFLIILVSCQKTTPYHSQSLRVNIGADPQTLDPRKARDLTTITLIRMLYEGLTRISKTGETELALAKSVEVSDDHLRYVFHLRKSFWSNGEPVTSYDFATSWKTILDPQFPTDIAYQLYVIKNGREAKLGEEHLDQVGIQTPDAHTLVVDLEQPIPYFLELLSMTSFFPIPHKLASRDSQWTPSSQECIGNGPFSLKMWKHSDVVSLKKNPYYWEAKEVSLTGIDLLMVSGDTEMRLFEEGKIDWAGSPLSTIPIDAIATLRAENKLHISPLSGTYFFRVNTSEKIKDKRNPLSSASFRKALSVAMCRKDVTDHILQGGQLAAKSLVPPAMGLSDNGYFVDAHRDTAHAFLMDALLELDLTLDKLEPVTISYCSNERNAAIAQTLQKQWEKNLGISVELQAIEPKVFFQRLAQKEFQLAAGSWTADFNDPINFLEVFKFKDASTNNTCWENSKYVELLNHSALCRDSEERRRILREAEQILMEQMPIIPVFHFALNFLVSDGLDKVALSPMGQIDFRWAKISDEGSLQKR